MSQWYRAVDCGQCLDTSGSPLRELFLETRVQAEPSADHSKRPHSILWQSQQLSVELRHLFPEFTPLLESPICEFNQPAAVASLPDP